MDGLIAAAQSNGQAPQVLAAAADGVVKLIDAMGGDVDRVFGDAGLNINQLSSPFNDISLRQYCRLFEEAARHTGCGNFGLRFGHDFKPRQLGPLGYMAINSPTVAAGLRSLVDYFPAHQQNTAMALREERDLVYLDYQITDGRIDRRRQDAELSLGMFCNILVHGCGRQWRPLEIHFEHPRPAECREHETLFGAPVVFAQPTNSILLRRADLDALMPDPDPYLFSLLEPFMLGRQRRALSDDLVGLVRRRIETHFNTGDPSIRRIAAELGMTSWTLQRRLRDLNVSFHDLVRGARRELALRYVAEPHLPLTEVAFLLGYSELSAFSRAFRQWTGVAPARYRRSRMESGINTPPPSTGSG